MTFNTEHLKMNFGFCQFMTGFGQVYSLTSSEKLYKKLHSAILDRVRYGRKDRLISKYQMAEWASTNLLMRRFWTLV